MSSSNCEANNFIPANIQESVSNFKTQSPSVVEYSLNNSMQAIYHSSSEPVLAPQRHYIHGNVACYRQHPYYQHNGQYPNYQQPLNAYYPSPYNSHARPPGNLPYHRPRVAGPILHSVQNQTHLTNTYDNFTKHQTFRSTPTNDYPLSPNSFNSSTSTSPFIPDIINNNFELEKPVEHKRLNLPNAKKKPMHILNVEEEVKKKREKNRVASQKTREKKKKIMSDQSMEIQHQKNELQVAALELNKQKQKIKQIVNYCCENGFELPPYLYR